MACYQSDNFQIYALTIQALVKYSFQNYNIFHVPRMFRISHRCRSEKPHTHPHTHTDDTTTLASRICDSPRRRRCRRHRLPALCVRTIDFSALPSSLVGRSVVRSSVRRICMHLLYCSRVYCTDILSPERTRKTARRQRHAQAGGMPPDISTPSTAERHVVVVVDVSWVAVDDESG